MVFIFSHEKFHFSNWDSQSWGRFIFLVKYTSWSVKVSRFHPMCLSYIRPFPQRSRWTFVFGRIGAECCVGGHKTILTFRTHTARWTRTDAAPRALVPAGPAKYRHVYCICILPYIYIERERERDTHLHSYSCKVYIQFIKLYLFHSRLTPHRNEMVRLPEQSLKHSSRKLMSDTNFC